MVVEPGVEVQDAGERGGVYRLLDHPWVFRLSQELFAPGASRRLAALAAEVFQQSRGPSLDAGCGPHLTTQAPLDGAIVGVDMNAAYLGRYLAEAPGRRAVLASADRLPFCDGAFADARCWGLLHHLPPDSASSVVRELVRCVRPGGEVVVLDNVWPRSAYRRPLAWLVRRLDRGAWIRSEQELRRLVTDAAPGAWSGRRVTYSYNGLEGLLLRLRVG